MVRRKPRLTIALAFTVAAALIAAPGAVAGFTQVGTVGLGVGVGAGQMKRPFRVDLSPNGSAYVVDRDNERIVKFGPSGAFERAWGRGVSGGGALQVCIASCGAGSQGTGAGELSFTWDVAVSPDGSAIYVSDYNNLRINEYTPAGVFVKAWGWGVVPGGGTGLEVCTTVTGCKGGIAGAGAGKLDKPTGIAVGPSGDVYVAENNNARVTRFTSAGAYVQSWSGDGIENPVALGIAPGGDVYVGSENGYVNRYSSAGAYLGRFGGPGGAPGLLSGMASIDVGPDGDILVAKLLSFPRGIHRFRSDLAFLELFETPNAPTAFTDAAFAPDGTVYAAQSGTGQLVKFALSPASPAPPPPDPEPEPEPAPPPGSAPPAPPSSPPPAVPGIPAKPPTTLGALPKGSAVISLPPARTCASRRNFRIRLTQPKGLKLSSAVVSVDGKRVKAVSGKRVTAPVDLRGLPKGRFTVKIAVTLADGRKLSSSRRYRTCEPSRRR